MEDIAGLTAATYDARRGDRTNSCADHDRRGSDARRVGEACGYRDRCRPNVETVHPQDASTRKRTGGAPLAATEEGF